MSRLKNHIIDADTPLTIRVTKSDIACATPCDPENCAIAQGAKRMDDVEWVKIGGGTCQVTFSNGVTKRYVLSSQDRAKVHAFDGANYFQPGKYTLLPPPPSRRLGSRRGTKSGSNTREGKTLTVNSTKPVPVRMEPLRHI